MLRVLFLSSLALLCAHSVTPAEDKVDLHKIPPEAKAILDKADSLELLSLDLATPMDDPKAAFHTWKVLGKKTIDKAELRRSLVEAFEKGVAEYKGAGKPCFFPRHGIRAKHDGKTADFVICFECLNARAYVDGGSEEEFLISDAPAKSFNKVLQDAGVALPAQPKK